jgi:hypothetical protein
MEIEPDRLDKVAAYVPAHAARDLPRYGLVVAVASASRCRSRPIRPIQSGLACKGR